MNKKQIIGILTFHNANNYGAVLQAYALQQYLKSVNIESKIINYDLISTKKLNVITNFLYILKSKVKYITNKSKGKRAKRFTSFRKKYLLTTKKRIYNDNMLKKLQNVFNTIIVGSDQVWNSEITKESNIFYVTFDSNAKKIAYAASYGRDYLLEKEIKFAKEYLEKFNYISVREKSIINILNKNIKKNIYYVIDPVFLLNNEQWNSIIPDNKYSDKYIFVYSMEQSEIMKSLLKKVKQDAEYKIIITNGSDTNNYKMYGQEENTVGPIEFLSLIKNAEYVITNSFHGLALSLILKKDILCVAHSSKNDRLQNLLELAKKENNQINSLKQINEYKKNIISDYYDNDIKILIKKSKKFLEESIGDNQNEDRNTNGSKN